MSNNPNIPVTKIDPRVIVVVGTHFEGKDGSHAQRVMGETMAAGHFVHFVSEFVRGAFSVSE